MPKRVIWSCVLECLQRKLLQCETAHVLGYVEARDELSVSLVLDREEIAHNSVEFAARKSCAGSGIFEIHDSCFRCGWRRDPRFRVLHRDRPK